MTGYMLKATAELQRFLRSANVDLDKVAVIIVADDVETRSRIEGALARDFSPITFIPAASIPSLSAFKMLGVRVVLSDLSDERPTYLIASEAPQ